MQDASLGISLVLTHFLFSRYGGGPCSPVRVSSNSPITMIKDWILRPARDSNNSPARCDQKIESSVQVVGFVFGSTTVLPQRQVVSMRTFTGITVANAEDDDESMRTKVLQSCYPIEH